MKYNNCQGSIKMTKIAFALSLIFYFNAFSQTDSNFNSSLERALNTAVPNCQDISLNAKRLFKDYYQRGRIDSINLVIKYLKDKCTQNYIQKSEIILSSILSNSFNDSLIDSSMFIWASSYQRRPDKLFSWRFDYGVVEGNKYFLKEIHQFMSSVYDSLSRVLDTSTTQYLLSLYYSGKYDIFYYKLRHSPAFKKSILKSLYDKKCRSELFETQQRFGFSVGYWGPIGELSILGPHPEIGGYLGIRWWKIYGDFAGFLRFNDAKNEYKFMSKDSLYKTKYFSEWSLGGEFGFEVLRKYKNQFDLLFGVGSDHLTAIDPGIKAENRDIKTIYYSPGIGYRYYLGKYKAIILNPQIRYTFLDYSSKNLNGSNLNGNILSIRLCIGISDHLVDDQELEYLRYFDKYFNYEKTLN
jgi:hypothetical protein